MKCWRIEAYGETGYVKAVSRAKARWMVVHSLLDVGWIKRAQIGQALRKIAVHRYPLMDLQKDWRGCRDQSWMDSLADGIDTLRGDPDANG